MIEALPLNNLRDLRTHEAVQLRGGAASAHAKQLLFEMVDAQVSTGRVLGLIANDPICNPVLFAEFLCRDDSGFKKAVERESLVLLRFPEYQTLAEFNEAVGFSRANPDTYKRAKRWAPEYDGLFVNHGRVHAKPRVELTAAFHRLIHTCAEPSLDDGRRQRLRASIDDAAQRIGRRPNWGEFYPAVQDDLRIVRAVRTAYATAYEEANRLESLHGTDDVRPFGARGEHRFPMPRLAPRFSSYFLRKLNLEDAGEVREKGHALGIYRWMEQYDKARDEEDHTSAAEAWLKVKALSQPFLSHLSEHYGEPVLCAPSTPSRVRNASSVVAVSSAALWLGGVLEEPTVALVSAVTAVIADKASRRQEDIS